MLAGEFDKADQICQAQMPEAARSAQRASVAQPPDPKMREPLELAIMLKLLRGKPDEADAQVELAKQYVTSESAQALGREIPGMADALKHDRQAFINGAYVTARKLSESPAGAAPAK